MSEHAFPVMKIRTEQIHHLPDYDLSYIKKDTLTNDRGGMPHDRHFD